jgi:hypothetical protein
MEFMAWIPHVPKSWWGSEGYPPASSAPGQARGWKTADPPATHGDSARASGPGGTVFLTEVLHFLGA